MARIYNMNSTTEERTAIARELVLATRLKFIRCGGLSRDITLSVSEVKRAVGVGGIETASLATYRLLEACFTNAADDDMACIECVTYRRDGIEIVLSDEYAAQIREKNRL